MKYMAKGPDGLSYQLTREELETPSVVQQLKLDDTWVIRVGDEWFPLPKFRELTADQLRDRSEQKSGAIENAFAPNARWTPASVLCLVIRIIGFYFLTQVAQGLVSLFTTLTTPGGISFRMWVGPILSYICYVILGLYLLMGARTIVNFAFRTDGLKKPR